MEGVSLIFFYSSITLLSVTITLSTGTVRAYETELQLGSGFRDDFQVGSDSVFGDDYRVNRDYRVNKDCAPIRNKAPAGEAVSSTIYKAAATLFSVTITESTGIVRTEKTRHQLGK